MRCARCGAEGAGVKYKTWRRGPWWFHLSCWAESRRDMRFTRRGESVKVGEIESAERASAQPTLDPLPDARGRHGNV